MDGIEKLTPYFTNLFDGLSLLVTGMGLKLAAVIKSAIADSMPDNALFGGTKKRLGKDAQRDAAGGRFNDAKSKEKFEASGVSGALRALNFGEGQIEKDKTQLAGNRATARLNQLYKPMDTALANPNSDVSQLYKKAGINVTPGGPGAKVEEETASNTAQLVELMKSNTGAKSSAFKDGGATF